MCWSGRAKSSRATAHAVMQASSVCRRSSVTSVGTMNRATVPPPKYHVRVGPLRIPSMSTPERLGLARACLQIMVAALIVRMVGAIALGEGAPFGPDGTGAQASVALGGHPYPLHTLMLSIFGADARALSMLCGALNRVLIAVWGRRVGLGMAGGWLAVFAPLSVMPGVLAAGDAPP